jgi:thiol-disulfide isomerase/thioredoxin
MSRRASARPPDRRKLIGITTLVVIVVAVIAVVGLYSRPNTVVPQNATKAVGSASIKVGDKAPEFSVQTNAGPFDLAGVSGPVLLEVFATWCPHCQHETTTLNTIAAKYQGKLAVVAVSGDAFNMEHNGPESLADVNTFGATYNVRYPIAFDGDLKVAQAYLKDGFPTLVLISPDKKITWMQDGEVPPAALEAAIKGVVGPSTGS